MRNVQVQAYGCTQTIDILVHSKQHLDADENKDDTKSVLQILEVFGHSCQRKVQGSEPEDGKDVGGKHNERVTANAEYGRDAIYGKGDIGGLDDSRATNSGVAIRRPFSMMKKWSPCMRSVTG